MEFIREILELNHDIIYFAYGLVFFVLGLSIALQSRSYSRLDLARSLKWLAAFGFTHGFYEWGDLFIPIQSAYMSASTVRLLNDFHLLLLGISFALMFEFGVTLLKPLGELRWLHAVPGTVFAIWFFFSYFPLPRIYPDFQTWHDIANALARYLIGFPGGLLAAYGLRQHALDRIMPLRVPHIVNMLRFAGIMLAVYAVLGGLISPPIPFFPGNLLNSQTVQDAIVFPPAVLRSIVGLGLVIAIIRALEVFDVETERIIESMEQKQILTAERERIGRQLHDGAIQKVYTAGLLVESARKLTEKGNPLSVRLEKAMNVLNDAISDLRQSLGDLQTTPKRESPHSALRKMAEDPRFQSLIQVRLMLDLPESEMISPARSDHVMAIVNEALSNAIRHARANQVTISAWREADRLLMRIEDDGIGLAREVEAGFGLRNMHDRARLLGGSVEVSSANGKGTLVTLEIPMRDDRL
jgi:signal transduction histidine kinase